MGKCNCCKNKIVSTSIAVNTGGTALVITIPATTVLTIDTKYCLVIAQPLPEAGENLPVHIEVSGTTVEIPLYKTVGKIKGCGCIQCTFGDIEYGIDLPERGRVRIPLFFSDASIFYDLRGIEHLCLCKEV